MFISGTLIGEELKSLRVKKNLSLEQVSHELSIHFTTLSKYEKDASDMKLGMLEKILNFYQVDELIFFKIIREFNHTNK